MAGIDRKGSVYVWPCIDKTGRGKESIVCATFMALGQLQRPNDHINNTLRPFRKA